MYEYVSFKAYKKGKSLFFVHAFCYSYDTIDGLDATVVNYLQWRLCLLMLYGTILCLRCV